MILSYHMRYYFKKKFTLTVCVLWWCCNLFDICEMTNVKVGAICTTPSATTTWIQSPVPARSYRRMSMRQCNTCNIQTTCHATCHVTYVTAINIYHVSCLFMLHCVNVVMYIRTFITNNVYVWDTCVTQMFFDNMGQT